MPKAGENFCKVFIWVRFPLYPQIKILFMKIIGITGRMGSGKTTIGEYLTIHLNIPVFDCDSAAKTAYNNEVIIGILKCKYGHKVVTAHGIDKKGLADIIFNDNNEMEFVKALVNPFINDEFNKFKCKCNDLKLGVCAIESATLLSSKLYNECSFVLVKTTESDKVNIERSIKRSYTYVSEEEIKSRLDKQMTNEQMLKFNRTHEIKDSLLPDQIENFVYSLL